MDGFLPTYLEERMKVLARECILELPVSISIAELTVEFEAELIRQGLLGGICHLLITQAGAVELPEEILEWARGHFRGQFFQAASFHALLKKLDQGLARRGIYVLLLKGAHLSVSHYPVLGTRHLSDVDIYVPDRNWSDMVAAVLAECGLTPPSGLGTWQDELGRQVDVHTPDDEIVEAGLMDLRLAVERSELLPGYSHLKGMGHEDLTTYVSLHALKHGFCKLGWLWDLERLDATRSGTPLPPRARAYIAYVMNEAFRLGGERPRLSWWERALLRRMLKHPYSGLGQVMLSLAMKSRVQMLVFLIRSALFDNFGNRKSFRLKGLRAKVRNIFTALWS
jgi:hypothetical protein